MAKGLKTIRQTAKSIGNDTDRIERYARLLEGRLRDSKSTVLAWKEKCAKMEKILKESEDALKEKDAIILAYAKDNGEALTNLQVKIEDLEKALKEREDALKEKNATILAYANGEVLTAAQTKIEELENRLQGALNKYKNVIIPKITNNFEELVAKLEEENKRLKNAEKWHVLRGRGQVRVELLKLDKEHQEQIDELFVEFKKEIDQVDSEYTKIVDELEDAANQRIEAIQKEAKEIEELFSAEIALKDEELKRAMARVKELSDESKELGEYVEELKKSICQLEIDKKALSIKLDETTAKFESTKTKAKKYRDATIGVGVGLGLALVVAGTAGAMHPYVEYLDKYEQAMQENASLVDQLAQKDAKIAELSEKLETTLNNLDAAKLDFEQRLADLDLSTVDKVALGEIFGEDFSGLSDAEVLAKLESERLAYEAAIVKLKNDLDLKNFEIENLNGTIERLEYLVDSLEKENKLLESLTNKASDSLVGGGNTVSSAGVSEKFEVVRNDGAVETREVIAGKTCVTSVVSKDAFTGAETVVEFEYDENGNLISQTVTQIAGNGDIISQIVSDVVIGEGGNSAEPGNQGGTGDATEDDSEDVRWN